MSRAPLNPAGRGVDSDHPDNERMARRVAAKANREAQALFEQEERLIEARRSAAAFDDGLDRYDPADRAYQLMEAEEVGPHPNDWVWG